MENSRLLIKAINNIVNQKASETARILFIIFYFWS